MDQKTPPLIRVQLSGKIIGQGAYAVVKEGFKSGSMCAVKMFHPKLLEATKGKKYCKNMFEYEASILAILDHPNIVKFFGKCYESGGTDNPPWLVMERLHTSLRSLINEQCLNPLSKVKILCDVTAGLKYLHSSSLGIVHCDLTPNNILITKTLKAKIGDFGVSKFLSDGQLTIQTPGTQFYMAPEARQVISSYNEKLDIYSFGWVVIFTFLGVDPDETNSDRVEDRNNQILKLPELLQKLVAQCLQDEPQERPSASEVFTELHHIAEILKCDRQHTDDMLSSATSVQTVSNASQTGYLHQNYSNGLLTSHCNSAPAGCASYSLPRQNKLLHNNSQLSRKSDDVTMSSSTLNLSASPITTYMTGSRAGPELAANCSCGHPNFSVQNIRNVSSLIELFCRILKCQVIQEFSSVADLQHKSWSIAPVKFLYVSTDASQCAYKDYDKVQV